MKTLYGKTFTATVRITCTLALDMEIKNRLSISEFYYVTEYCGLPFTKTK
jgi:hypothetical protein